MPPFSKNFLLGAAVAILLITTIVFGALWFRTKQEVTLLRQGYGGQAEEKPQVPDATSPASSGVEGWKTYRNEKYGLEMEYPPTWKISDALNQLFLEDYNSPPNVKFPIFTIYDKEDYVAIVLREKEEEYVTFVQNYEGIGVGTTWVGYDGDLITIEASERKLEEIQDKNPFKEGKEGYGWGRQRTQSLIIDSLPAKRTLELWRWEGDKDEDVAYIAYQGDMKLAGNKVNTISIGINYNKGKYQKEIFERVVNSFRYFK